MDKIRTCLKAWPDVFAFRCIALLNMDSAVQDMSCVAWSLRSLLFSFFRQSWRWRFEMIRRSPRLPVRTWRVVRRLSIVMGRLSWIDRTKATTTRGNCRIADLRGQLCLRPSFKKFLVGTGEIRRQLRRPHQNRRSQKSRSMSPGIIFLSLPFIDKPSFQSYENDCFPFMYPLPKPAKYYAPATAMACFRHR